MTPKKRRTFFINDETDAKLNNWVGTWCAASNQTSYGATSHVVDAALTFFTDYYSPESYSGSFSDIPATTKIAMKITGEIKNDQE